ncbi:MAG: CDP-diacylglycerol--serine O-phosphatidyltransferase [Acidobacteria bacterium]|nr:CDP-diacylglycerol--serine O-phosphatidyltransferase [Acidobacteriota bacterium]
MTPTPRRQLKRGIYVLPSLLTTGNLFAGFFSIVSALHGDFREAAIALGIAFVLDGLDGRIARMTNTESEFGKIYDSLADLLSWGAAPAVLLLSWGLWDLGRVGWLASFFFLVCAALRLARFSVHVGDTDRRFFIGLPTPAAACLFASVVFFWPTRLESVVLTRLLLGVVIVVSLFMVSKIRYRSFKDFDLRRRQPYSVILLLATVITLIALDPERVLLLIAVGYVVAGPVERGVVRLTAPAMRLRDSSHEEQS